MSVKFETLQSCNGLPAASSRNSKKVTLNSFDEFSLGIRQLCVSAQAFSERKRSSGNFKSLLKQKKTPEDLRFGKKTSTREDVSWIFVIFSDVILICAFQLKRFSIKEGLADILKYFSSN